MSELALTEVEKFEREYCKRSDIKKILNCHFLIGDISFEERKIMLKNLYEKYDAAVKKDAEK